VEREERVGWRVSAGLGAERRDPVDRFLFERRVGVLVGVGGLNALVPEPEGDRGDVDAPCPESIALVCRSVCGLIGLSFSDGQLVAAMAVYLVSS
jgi:hypothetical protein